MSSSQSPLEKGVTYAEQAVAADNTQDYERAYQLYLLCLKWLDHARKYAPTPLAAGHIADAMLPRLQRAEDLQEQLYGNEAKVRKRAGTQIQGGPGTTGDDDLQQSLKGAVLGERPTTRLCDVAGLDDVKQALKETVMVPLQAPQLMTGRVIPWKGILLYGPPGTGKTHIARAIAGESGCTFFSVSAADLVNKYVGQSERLVRTLYDMARAAKPSIIFVDEIESVVPVRGGSEGGGGTNNGGANHMDRVVTEFLKQVDGLGMDNTGILTLAATNLPWQIDKAALRRFERRIYVPLPGPEARATMLTPDLIRTGATPQEIMDMVSATEGYSGSDIANVLKDGNMKCLRRVLDATHFCPSPTEKGAFVPCEDGSAPGAVASSYEEWRDKSTLRCPPTTTRDYLDALQVMKPSVKQAGLEQFLLWEASK
jgi:vacuolar protein-sorting-associated protein 4